MMMRDLLCCAIAIYCCLGSAVSVAETEAICRYGSHELPAPLTDKPGRKYARDRFADILHLKLDVTPDFAKRTVSGTATLSFKPIAKPLTRLELDAVGLTIDGITAKWHMAHRFDLFGPVRHAPIWGFACSALPSDRRVFA